MLVTLNSTDNYAKREAGGKGYNLFLLSKEGFSVPQWVVLGARYFHAFRVANALNDKIESILSQAKETKKLAEAAEAIRQLILKSSMPAEIEADARKAYEMVGAPFIAIRSSAVDEDSAQHSFAGQLSSYLFVRSFEEAMSSIRECWASAYSERGLSYRLQNKLEFSNQIGVAVVVQAMLDSEKSGVLFTCDPIKNDPTRVTINSVYGVGEGLVSGLLDGDTYLLDKATGKKIEQELANKTSKMVRPEGGSGVIEADVAPHLQQIQSLSDAELSELVTLGNKVEKFYRSPQDVEWGWREGKFYLLQSRPVTTTVRANEGTLFIWDNSNIVESYGGITLPLTFSFAHHNYHQVYVQMCEILMVPQNEIKNMEFLRNMLGTFYGRVYYNLINWYKLTSILPGFKYNRSFMETMMGTDQSLADEIADRIKPPGFQEKFSSKVRRAIQGAKFLYFHFTAQSMVDGFMEHFYKVYKPYRELNFSRMPAYEIYDHYLDLERELLREWKAPIINDYLCMIHFGILKKLTSKWLAHLGDALQNELLCGAGNLESAEPTRELIRMAGDVAADAKLRQLIENTPAEDLMEALKQSSFKEFTQRVDRYIYLYGHRCMSEMKLEQKDLNQDPTFLLVCLKNYLRSGQIDLAEYEKREHEIRDTAEKKVAENISGWKKVIYNWSLKCARMAVRNRENTRFCRTRIYGIVRSMFFGIGNDYTLKGMIDVPEDIFYITLAELRGSLEGVLPCQDLKALIQVRKQEFAKYQDAEPAPRFMTRGPVYWNNEHFPVPETVDLSDVPENCLKGIGCCPGIIEGIVKVILSPDDNMELNGEILVTFRTDPGWIPLYPSVSGLLVERGGLLSHSAIVAREMGLPTVVGVKNLVQTLKSGMRVRINGQSGLIEILDQQAT